MFFWQLGEYDRAAAEFETSVKPTRRPGCKLSADCRISEIAECIAIRDFQRPQILNLANLNDETSLDCPRLFQSHPFWSYFRDLVTLAGQNAHINPAAPF